MSTVPMISENWANILEPGLRAIWYQQINAIVGSSPVPLLFNMQTSEDANEETLGIGGLGDVPEYNGVIEYDSIAEDYKKTFLHTEFAKGISIERKLYDDGKYGVMNTLASQLGLSFARKREKDAASVFNNAFSSSYLGTDGKALCADDHHRGKRDTTAQDNKGTTALTYDAVISTRQLMRKFVDDRNQLVAINPDTIVVPVELESTAWTIANSMNKPGTANNDGNFVASRGFKVVVWDYLTDANNWFMVDSQLAKMHLYWFDRVAPEFAIDPTGTFNLKANYRGYMRYSYGFDDYRWIYGHEVA
jgi:hypothetical protein